MAPKPGHSYSKTLRINLSTNAFRVSHNAIRTYMQWAGLDNITHCLRQRSFFICYQHPTLRINNTVLMQVKPLKRSNQVVQASYLSKTAKVGNILKIKMERHISKVLLRTGFTGFSILSTNPKERFRLMSWQVSYMLIHNKSSPCQISPKCNL